MIPSASLARAAARALVTRVTRINADADNPLGPVHKQLKVNHLRPEKPIPSKNQVTQLAPLLKNDKRLANRT